MVVKMGFLPLFKNGVEGFSIEEMTPPELWFADDIDGPWEWKGPVARGGACAYGKLYGSKAGFVSLDWLPHLINWRRSVAPPFTPREEMVYNTLVARESMLSKEIKRECGFTAPREPQPFAASALNAAERALERRARRPQGEGYETLITRLQMETYVIAADFEYLTDKRGHPYGWGIARYTTPELMFGPEAALACDGCTPQESRRRMLCHLASLLPQATEEQLLKIIG